MNSIPLEDKEKVITRIAEGQSYADAIKDTSIKSKDTVHRIVKQSANAIERKRQQYLKKIKQFGATDSRRARMWVEMMHAKKTRLYGSHAFYEPDWSARATALKYIDSLGDLDKENEIKMEFTDKTPQQEIDPNSKEVIDFSAAFRRYLEQER